MRFAFADPPYLGCGARYDEHHAEARTWDNPKTHNALVERLVNEYPDGWLMCLSSPSLKTILPMCPDDCRVGAWVKPFAAFKVNVNPAYAWEPVIWRGGSIWQGAPLSVRTNHIKDSDHRKRRKAGRWCNGTNALGISLVGACKVAGRSITDVKCIGWDATQPQQAAAMAAVDAVRRRYNISRCAVWGHGELQHDRRSYEGSELARLVRRGC